jgi:hypothetical protein
MEGMDVWFPNRPARIDKNIRPPGANAPAITCHRWSKESTATFERITDFRIFSKVGEGFEPRMRRTWPDERFPDLAG